MSWYSPKAILPPQGVKIIWFKDGDVYVSHRIGHKYLCLFPDEAKILEEPKLWTHCPVPQPYEGRWRVKLEGCDDMLNIDELEERFPEEHKKFVDMVYEGKIASGEK